MLKFLKKEIHTPKVYKDLRQTFIKLKFVRPSFSLSCLPILLSFIKNLDEIGQGKKVKYIFTS